MIPKGDSFYNFYISMYPITTNLYIFRLGFVLSHSTGQELAYIDPFLANVPTLYPLETPGNQTVSSIFRGYKMGIMARNYLITFIIARSGPAKKISFSLACCFIRQSGGGGEVQEKGGLKLLENSVKGRRH